MKARILQIFKNNSCTYLQSDPFKDIEQLLTELTHDSETVYKNMYEHICDQSYLSDELLDDAIRIGHMNITDGMNEIIEIAKYYDTYDEQDTSNIMLTYIMCYAYARGYPRLQIERYEVFQYSLFELSDGNECWFNKIMQTLFTIHALIYDKQDVKQWWNDLSEHCKNTFKTELQKILDNNYQHEYLATTKYFDEFTTIYTCIK